MPRDREIRLVVFDVDGTLYDQRRLRAVMAAEILATCVRSPRAVRDIRLVRQYRRCLEDAAADGGGLDAVASRTALATGAAEDRVRAVAEEWLQHRPLRHLPRVGLPPARATVDALRRAGVMTAAWSDYPVAEKLRALDVDVDFSVWSGDAGVGALKPHPAGLEEAMSRAGASAAQTLMVGDRAGRDGAAAAAVGVAFVLAARGVRERESAEILSACGLDSRIPG